MWAVSVTESWAAALALGSSAQGDQEPIAWQVGGQWGWAQLCPTDRWGLGKGGSVPCQALAEVGIESFETLFSG